MNKEKVKILVIEDDGIVASDLKNILQSLGYSVPKIVSSGEDALEWLEGNQSDLVLTDIRLKGQLDGIDTASIIKERWQIPHIFITAYADSKTLERAKVTEPVGYIVKPFDELNLRSTIEMALFKSRAEKNLKKAAEEWAMTFNSIADLIFILDRNHTIIKANKALLDFFGKSEQEIIGKKCYELVHKQHEPWKNCPLVVTCQSKKPHTEEVDDPGLGKVLLITTSPILDNSGEIIGITHVAKDITERKKIEQAKDEFISLASHQLRTPLAGISLSAELLLRESPDAMVPAQKEYLDEIYKSTKRMTLLVNNLLNVSRLEMGSFAVRMAPLDVSSAIEAVLKDFSTLAADKNLKIDKIVINEIPVINFDENIFGIIFQNILANAIRYTPSGGKVKIELGKEGKEKIILKVTDTGAGIPDDQKENVFEKSFRAENAKEISSEGAGLGLYMAKALADQSGAKIWFESKKGEGTTFFVSIPVNSA